MKSKAHRESHEAYKKRMRKTYATLEAQHKNSPLRYDCNTRKESQSSGGSIEVYSFLYLLGWGIEKVQQWRNRNKPEPTMEEIIENIRQNQIRINEEFRKLQVEKNKEFQRQQKQNRI